MVPMIPSYGKVQPQLEIYGPILPLEKDEKENDIKKFDSFLSFYEYFDGDSYLVSGFPKSY